jgi:phage baseplate assembly protein W
MNQRVLSPDSDTKAYLGVGWPFPVKPVAGRLSYVAHEEDVEQAIQVILLTARNERVMLPAFGAGARNFVFEPNSPATHRRIEKEVDAALVDWEPRIAVDRVEVTADAADPNVLLIHLDYEVLATNTYYNRVYPFDLLEAGA